jgi:hypothetical protein
MALLTLRFMLMTFASTRERVFRCSCGLVVSMRSLILVACVIVLTGYRDSLLCQCAGVLSLGLPSCGTLLNVGVLLGWPDMG